MDGNIPLLAEDGIIYNIFDFDGCFCHALEDGNPVIIKTFSG